MREEKQNELAQLKELFNKYKVICIVDMLKMPTKQMQLISWCKDWKNSSIGGTTRGALLTKSRGRSPSDDIREIKESDAFRKWQNEQDVNNYEFLAFLKAVPYTPKQLLAEHFGQLKNSAVTIKDKEILKFLSWLENKFKDLLQ